MSNASKTSPSRFVVQLFQTVVVITALVILSPSCQQSPKKAANIEELRRAAENAQAYLLQHGVLPSDACAAGIPTYLKIHGTNEMYLIIAPDTFHEKGRAFRYACDRSWHLVRLYQDPFDSIDTTNSAIDIEVIGELGHSERYRQKVR